MNDYQFMELVELLKVLHRELEALNQNLLKIGEALER